MCVCVCVSVHVVWKRVVDACINAYIKSGIHIITRSDFSCFTGCLFAWLHFQWWWHRKFLIDWFFVCWRSKCCTTLSSIQFNSYSHSFIVQSRICFFFATVLSPLPHNFFLLFFFRVLAKWYVCIYAPCKNLPIEWSDCYSECMDDNYNWY